MGSGGKAPKVHETAAQGTSNIINAKLWNYYQTNYKPLMDKWISKTINPLTEAQEKEQVAGAINADVMKNVDPTKASVNPAQNARALNELAGIETKAQVAGEGKARGRTLGERQAIIDIGRGQEGEAQEGIQSLAASSVREAIGEEESKQVENASTENAIGSGIGTVAALGYRQLKDPANWDKNLFGSA
jgi:hypothetical protein